MTARKRLLRRHDPDDLTPEQQNRMCPSCRIRYRLEPPPLREDYGPWRIDAVTFAWIENAARDFDADAGDERFTASEFVAWIRPDVVKERAA